jgi:hypothetical protein
MLPVSLDCPFLIAHSVSSNAFYVILFKSIKVGMEKLEIILVLFPVKTYLTSSGADIALSLKDYGYMLGSLLFLIG